MAKKPEAVAKESISVDTKWVLSGICAVGIILMGGLAYWIKDTASAGHTVQVEMTKEIGVMRSDVVKALAGVEKEVAITNTKLDATNAKLDAVINKLPPQFR